MELRSKSEFFKTYANGVNGVSFSGVVEYYTATLANDIDDDGKPNKPLFDKDKWETDRWKTDIQSTGYGTPGEGDVIYKYLWNVEVVSSKDANNVTTQTPTNVELYQTYVGGRIPSEYISYYSTNSSSGAPDKQPYVDTTNGNSIVVPTDTTWVVGSSFSGSADENDYLFEISFVKYANKDENGLNQYAKMSGPTVIGRNGTNGISATNLVLDNDSDIISKNSLGTFLSSENYLTKVKAEFFNGSSLVSDADIALTAPASLYTEQGTLNSDYAVYSSNELTITNLPATFTEGNFTFSCGGQEKIFKLLVVQSEVDYDLVINKTVINTTNNGGTIVIKANRKDINGVTTLTGPDDNINLYSGDSNDPITNWSIVYNQGEEKPLKLVLKTGNVIWDEETIEFVKNGEKGDQGTGVNIKANADSCIELGDAYIDKDGILRILTSTNPREFTEGGEIKGPRGIGISSVINYYLLSDNTTGITISTEGWSTTLVSPSKEQGKKYLWNYEEIKYTEGKDPTCTTPAIIASYNEDGRGIVKIEEFYLISSDTTESKPSETPRAPDEKPVANVWYNVPISTTEQYCFLWNCEKITYTTGNPEITDPVIIGTHGAKGDNAKDFNITASSYAIIKDEQGNIKTDTSIVLTAHKINLGNESVSWRKNSTTSNVIATGNTYTLDFAQDGAGTYYATCGDWSDSVTIIEVSDGTNGKSAISIVLSNPTMTFHKQASNESEACEVIVYEGGTKLELGSFAIVEKVASENVSISNANIIVSDPQESGSYSFTVSVTSSANETSTQDFTIYWKVVNDGNDAVSYSLLPAPLSWNKTTNSKQIVNFVAWKHEGGTQERLTDGYTITYNSKEITNDSVEIEDTTTFTLNITDAPGVATATVTAVSDGEEGPPTTMYTISSEVGEVPYNSAVTGTTVQFNINKIVGSNISPLDEEAKIYYSIGEGDKINITTSPIELPFKIENAQAEIVYHFYEKVGENYVKIETKRIQVLRAEQTYYLYHDQLQPDQTLIRPSGSYNSPSGQWYNEKKDGSKFQSWARISEDKLDEPANWSSVENIDGTIISKSNLFDILGEQDGIYNLDGSIAIKAGAIQTGALQVKDGNNVLFEADFGKDNTTGRVNIAGWNVDKNSISKGDALIYSGDEEKYHLPSLTNIGTSPIRFGSGQSAYVENYKTEEWLIPYNEVSDITPDPEEGEETPTNRKYEIKVALDENPKDIKKCLCDIILEEDGGDIQSVTASYSVDSTLVKINFSSDTEFVKIRINIKYTYLVISQKTFAVLEDGSMYVTGAKITGDIEAKTLSTAPIYGYTTSIDIIQKRNTTLTNIVTNKIYEKTFSFLLATPDILTFWETIKNQNNKNQYVSASVINFTTKSTIVNSVAVTVGEIRFNEQSKLLQITTDLKVLHIDPGIQDLVNSVIVDIKFEFKVNDVTISEQPSFSTDENGQVKFQVGQLGCWELDNFGLHGSTYDPNGNLYTISLTPNGISAKPNISGDSYNFSWFDLFNSLPTSTNLAMIAETSFEEEI